MRASPTRSLPVDDFSPQSAALFGEDHDKPSEYGMCSVGSLSSSTRSATACAISVGGIAALARKGGTSIPNEDCLYAFDDGVLAVHIVADGHHGHEASHDLVEALTAAYDEFGPQLDPQEALELVPRYRRVSAGAGSGGEEAPPASRTTLVVACLDRRNGRLRGVSIGDSATFVGNLEVGLRRVVAPAQRYAAPWDYLSLGGAGVDVFDVAVSPGDWVMCCTDGITECCYGNPDSSIQESDLETLIIRAGGVPDCFVESVASLALTGVHGHPGGEDNLAIVASIV